MTENVYESPSSKVGESQTANAVDPKIMSFSGRLGRMRAFAYLMGSGLLTLCVAGLGAGLAALINPILGIIPYLLASIAAMVFAFSVYIRRLHDLGQTGWLSLLTFVPLVNLLLVIYLFCFKGNSGENLYGPPTTPNTGGVKALFWIGIVLFILSPIVAAVTIPSYQNYLQRSQEMQAPGYP